MPRLSKSAAVIATLVLFGLFWPTAYLTARSNGKLLLAWPIRVGEMVELSYTHSVNLSPVIDVIEWTGREFVVRKSVFKTFGAGIPMPSDGIGTELISVNGHYELVGIDKPMQSIPVMTQTVPNHRIVLKRREASLLKLAGSGKVVEIEVTRMSVVTRLYILIFH